MKSYQRVIPRDLFNEANLLKCLGQLYLKLEFHNFPNVSLEHDNWAFDVRQYEDDGSIYCINVQLMVRGNRQVLYRPLNSRAPWPLYCMGFCDIEIEVFTEKGELSADMIDFLKGHQP